MKIQSEAREFSSFKYETLLKKYSYSKEKTALKAFAKKFVHDYEYHVFYEALFIRGKRYAQILARQNPKDPFMGKTIIVEVDYRIRSKKAFSWVGSKLKQIFKDHQSEKINVVLHAAAKNQIKFLSQIGLRVECIVTIADFKDVYKGYKSLKKTSLPEFLKVEKVKAADLSNIKKIIVREFKRNPQYGIRVSPKTFIEILKEEIKKKEHFQYVFKNNKGKVLGQFGSFIHRNHPYWGGSAGINLCLDQSIQRFGLLDGIYSILINDIKKSRVQVLTSSTTHPAVIKRSKIFKRVPLIVRMERDSRLLKLDQFKDYLKI